MRSRSFFSEPAGKAIGLSNEVNTAAALASISPRWNTMAIDMLRQSATDTSAVSSDYWRTRRFAPFVLGLHALDPDGRPTGTKLDLPYQEVIASWHDETALAQALSSVCDFHVDNMIDTGSDKDPEFDTPPFDLLPVEIILITQVRDNLGLPTPSIDHPLIEALGTTKPIETEPDHPTLELLEATFG